MLEEYMDIISKNLINIFIALVILFVGFKIINFISYIFKRAYRNKISNDAIYFLFQIAEIFLKGALIISLISFLGIPTTSFVAILGSVGLAIGLSLQGSLANFAGGFLILILKPFKSGDYITGAGHSGTVEEIQIFYTKLLTFDNKVIIIPNSQLSNDSIINFTANDKRRIDINLGVDYGQNIDKVKETVLKVVNRHPKILPEPEPFVRLAELGESSINFTVRVWVNTEDYWATFYDLNEDFKKEFDKENIEIPFPKMDIYIKENAR